MVPAGVFPLRSPETLAADRARHQAKKEAKAHRESSGIGSMFNKMGSQKPKTERIYTDNAPPVAGPYSQGMATKGVISIADGLAHKIVYISGQMPVSYDGELLMNSTDPAKSSIAGQTTQCINNILAILRASKPENAEPKAEITDVIRTTVYLTDMKNFNEMNEAYAKAFGGHKPARTTIGVKELPKGIPVEIEAIGIV